jgi:predicted ester cyclase
VTVTTAADRTEELEEIVNAFRARAFIGRDLSAIDECLTEEFVDHFAPPDDPPGRDGVRHRFQQAADGFETTAVEVVHSMSKGDVLMQTIRIHMKHTGDFMGLPPTGREFWIPGFDAFELREGKIAGHWGAYDVSRIPDLLGLNAADSWAAMWSSTQQ